MGQVTGRVFLVGAGPGAADLVTLRGARAIRAADVLLCDDLLPRSLLEDLGVQPAGRTIEWLGGDGGHRSQDEINELMGRAALAGQTVARVKCGDPFVFGRGLEEIEYLELRGIPWEVVPGISSCLAAPAGAGLALTRRGHGRSFAVATARLAGGAVSQSFPVADSLVILMGAGALAEVVARLMADGWPRETPAVVIERAAQPWERRAVGQLATIAEAAASAGIGPPAVLVVGAAARGNPACPSRPRILFTGLDPANFRTLGDLLHWPALEIVADDAGRAMLPEVLAELGGRRFAWVVFTSRVGVRSFLAELRGRGQDARALAGARLVSAGAGTAAELAEHGLRSDAVAVEPGSPGILAALGQAPAGGRALVVQGSHAPRDLVAGMEDRGWQVTRLSLHRVVRHRELGRELPEHDVIYFVSPSGVRAFQETYGERAFRQQIWCIGEATQAELGRAGLIGKVVYSHAL